MLVPSSEGGSTVVRTTEPGADGDAIRTAPGEQTLALVESMATPIDGLPREAFENLLVVSAARPPGRVEAAVRRADADPATVGVVPVSGSPVDYDGPLWTASVVSPTDLTGIEMRFTDAMRHVKPDEGWVLFDNVNVLLMYAQSSNVYRLVSSLTGQARERGAHGVFALVRDAVSEETHSQFRSLFDAEVDRR